MGDETADVRGAAEADKLSLFPLRLSKFVSLVALSGELSRELDVRVAIADGRVALDGEVVSDPDVLIFPSGGDVISGEGPTSSADGDGGVAIAIDGRPLPSNLPPARTPELYYIDKPMNCVCDLSQDNAITRACASLGRGFAPVGQLDLHTTGLLLLTNDGDLSRLICLPGLLPKTYTVGFNGFSGECPLSDELRDSLVTPRDVSRPSDPKRSAVEKLSAISSAREAFRILNPQAPSGSRSRSRFECDVEISAGQNHIVKRLMASVGVMVCSLRRIAVGNLQLRLDHQTDRCHSVVGHASGVPLRSEEKRRFRKGTQAPCLDPTPVKVGDAELAELLSRLEYTQTLSHLRRADLICRWRHTAEERLGRWLNMTEEELQKECYHGFRRLTCKYPHDPRDEQPRRDPATSAGLKAAEV